MSVKICSAQFDVNVNLFTDTHTQTLKYSHLSTRILFFFLLLGGEKRGIGGLLSSKGSKEVFDESNQSCKLKYL